VGAVPELRKKLRRHADQRAGFAGVTASAIDFSIPAEIAVAREDGHRVLFKRGAHDIEAAQKRKEFPRARRAKRNAP